MGHAATGHKDLASASKWFGTLGDSTKAHLGLYSGLFHETRRRGWSHEGFERLVERYNREKPCLRMQGDIRSLNRRYGFDERFDQECRLVSDSCLLDCYSGRISFSWAPVGIIITPDLTRRDVEELVWLVRFV